MVYKCELILFQSQASRWLKSRNGSRLSGLDKIGVCAASDVSGSYGNAVPLLHEIRHALQKLLETGEETALDLRSMPMGPGDEDRLFDALGKGEVEAELNALGRSVIREAGISGVWLVEHYGPEGELTAKFMEVAWIPSILKAQTEDVREGLQRLSRRLAGDVPGDDD